MRSIEWPHTQENYVLKEMGYRVARKHAKKLRLVVHALAFALPLTAIAVALASGGVVAIAASVVAVALQATGHAGRTLAILCRGATRCSSLLRSMSPPDRTGHHSLTLAEAAKTKTAKTNAHSTKTSRLFSAFSFCIWPTSTLGQSTL